MYVGLSNKLSSLLQSDFVLIFHGQSNTMAYMTTILVSVIITHN